MNQLTHRFVIGNILTSVMLTVSIPALHGFHQKVLDHGSDPLLGFTIFFLTIIGIYASTLKSYQLAQQRRRSLRWYGKLFIVGLYLVSLCGTIILYAVATQLIYTSKELNNKSGVFLIVGACIYSFILLVLEGFYLEHPPEKPLSKAKMLIANYGTMMFSSLGISICWDTLVIGGGISFQPGLFSLIQLILLMMLLVFPFQRLFWYEVMTDVNSMRDQMKVIGSILLVILSGIVPLYFIQRGL